MATSKNSPSFYREKTFFITNFAIYYNQICKKKFDCKQIDNSDIKRWKNNVHQYTILAQWIVDHHLDSVLEKTTKEFESKNNNLDWYLQEDLQTYCLDYITKAVCSELEKSFCYNESCVARIKDLVKKTSCSYNHSNFDTQKEIINPLQNILYEGYRPIFSAIIEYFPSISMEELTQNIKNFQKDPCRYLSILYYLTEKILKPLLNKQIISWKNKSVENILPQIINLPDRFTDPFLIIRSNKNHENKDDFFINNYIKDYIEKKILLIKFCNELCIFVNQQSGIVDIENEIKNVFSHCSISKENHIILMYIRVMPLLFNKIAKYIDEPAVKKQIEKALLILRNKTSSLRPNFLYQYQPIEQIIEENKDLFEVVNTYNSIEYKLKNAYINWAKETNLFAESYTGKGENFEKVYDFLKWTLRFKITTKISNKGTINSLCSRLDKHQTLEEIKNIFNELSEEINKQPLKRPKINQNELIQKSMIDLFSKLETDEFASKLQKELNPKRFALVKNHLYALLLLTVIYNGMFMFKLVMQNKLYKPLTLFIK